jgi:hypothetical protein
MNLAQAQALLPGAALVGDGATGCARVHTDTRTLRPATVRRAARRALRRHDFLPQAGPPARWPRWPSAAWPKRPARPAGARHLVALGSWPPAGAASSAAADRRDRQQRQDHVHADDRQHPARRAGDARWPPRAT